MDAIMSLLQNFDFAAFIPELNTVLGWIELGVRIGVMIGPLVLLFLGLLSFLAPTKEANHRLGTDYQRFAPAFAEKLGLRLEMTWIRNGCSVACAPVAPRLPMWAREKDIPRYLPSAAIILR